MSTFIERIDPFFLAGAFALTVFVAWSIGWRCGRSAPEPMDDPDIRFTDAALALLGLLLAFTFSLSLERHDHRRAMVIAESNAIGDFYTCASLLPEPVRPRLQRAISEYTQYKVEGIRNLRTESDLEELIQGIQRMHARMTTLVAEAVTQGTPVAVSLTNTLNNVTSTHAARLAAFRERLPESIVLLLFIGAIVPAFLMGLQQGKSPRPHLSGTASFIFMVTLVVYVILDLNQPGSGMIRVNQEPFERLLQSMAQ